MATKRHLLLTKISAKEIRHQLGEVINQVAYGNKPYVITRRDKPLVVMLGIEEYEDIIDAMDTMAEQLDPEFQKSLAKGMRDFRAGRGTVLSTKEGIRKFFSSLG